MTNAIRRLASAVSISALAWSSASMAQPEPAAPPAEDLSESAPGAATDDPQTSQEIVVQGHIGYRNRSNTTEPVLVYDTDYFQRFEPLTIGDALKRVPSVTFLSDVIESDGARLRGLDPGYTQILINGEKVPGSNVDRSFFLDRIPAELVERVEIVRSNSARRTADAVAGTLNIVLRDALALDGGYVRGGVARFDDGEYKPNVGAVWGGVVGPGRLLIGGNVQGRYNPKKKLSLRYGDSPENGADLDDEFDNREVQSDVRDGTDYNANGSYAVEFGSSKVELSGFYVHTDRTEDERSFEYNTPEGTFGPVPDGEGEVDGLLTDNANIARINQDSYNLAFKLGHKWSAGETRFRATYASFEEDRDETEFEIDFDDDEIAFEGTDVLTDIVDREFALALDHKIPVAGGVAFQFGGYLLNKDRDSDIREGEQEADLGEEFRDWDQFEDDPNDIADPFDEFEPIAGGLNEISEKRRDLFALIEGDSGMIGWEVGVRYEHTNLDIVDLEEDEEFANDYGLLLPSASVKVDLTARDRITASVARTNRRPRFDYLSPAFLEEEFGDHDFVGNPLLDPETAWGVDVGYERRLGRTGVAGVNVFYRKVKDLVEIADSGEIGSNDLAVLQPQNTGDGKAWGIEFDLSTSLDFFGLPDTGIFGNYSWLDSEITDFAGKRRFNGQSKYVYNFGFIQNLRQLDAAFGATYRKQGPAFDRFATEEITTTYGADLEVFVEKRLWNRLTVRAVGSNLLNGKKKEAFNKFDSIEDQLERNFDEYELESEKAGPVFQLVGRFAF